MSLLLLFLSLHLTNAQAAEITDCGVNRLCIRIAGELTPQDVPRVKAAFAHMEPHVTYPPYLDGNVGLPPEVFLDSPGGAVEAAMELGRFLRSRRVWVWVLRDAQCASSCVLLLAAGAMRMIDGAVAIHRPYYVGAQEQSMSAAQAAHARLRDAVRGYLSEMNVSPSLYDAMIRTPPESAHILDRSELEDLGFLQVDPVEQEMQDVKEARHYKISRKELIARRAIALQVCGTGHNMTFEAAAGYLACQRKAMRGEIAGTRMR